MNIEITKELQNTVLVNPKIAKVYFDAEGRHYFNVHELITDTDSTEKRLYGTGVFSHTKTVDLPTGDRFKEHVCKGDASTEIVKTLSRDEILNAKVKSNEISLAAQVMNASESDRQNLLMALGLTPEIISAINAAKSTANPPAGKKEEKKG